MTKYDSQLQQWSRRGKDLDQSGLNADHKIDFINNLIKTRFRFDVDKIGRCHHAYLVPIVRPGVPPDF